MGAQGSPRTLQAKGMRCGETKARLMKILALWKAKEVQGDNEFKAQFAGC